MQESTAHDIDSPAMRQAGRDGLSLALIDARNHTLRLLAAHEAAVTQVAPAPAATGHAPAVWLAGHAGWFAEHWIARNTLRAQGSACPHQPPRLASIEPHADIWWAQHEPSQVPGPVGLPGFAATRAWLLETLETTLELLEKTPDNDDALYFYRLALCHDCLLYTSDAADE